MHPMLQSVQNNSGSLRRPRPTSPPVYPSQHANHVTPASPAQPPTTETTSVSSNQELDAPVCGLAAGSGVDEIRMRDRDIHRAARVPESNFFKNNADSIPQNDYERDLMYRSGQQIELNKHRVLTPNDFIGQDPTFNPAINHLKAAELKRGAEQTAFDEEIRNVCHQTKLRTALTRRELGAGLYYLYDFVQTYVDHPDGRVALNPQLVLVAQHAGNSILSQRLWAIAEDRNAWLRDLIEMAYMIVNDPYLNTEQQLSAICTTVVELSMKYAKLAAKNGYPSMPQMAKAQEFFYRVMEAILDLGVEVGVYNNRPVRYRQKRMSELPQLTDADYMFGLTQALENRPPQHAADLDGSPSEDSDYDDDYY
ncbi:52 kDa protein [Falcon aviadenovirus A]|nr:52 kDa protein [Falcon aviadenovirus A]